jgi:peptidylprolyl isomerase
MKYINRIVLPLVIILLTFSCSGGALNKTSYVLIKTTLGDIKIRLYNETPLHRDNFINLVKSQLYDDVLFHRIIEGFMIQTGDVTTKKDTMNLDLPYLSEYTIPAEFNKELFHKKGAVAAAREGDEYNPERNSSGTQFYIVQGKKYNDAELTLVEQRINNNIKQGAFIRFIKEKQDSVAKTGSKSDMAEIQNSALLKTYNYIAATGEYTIPLTQREIYKSLGGAPFLDATYTVFGEVVEGLEVVDKIASVTTGAGDKPISDIRILKAKVVKK